MSLSRYASIPRACPFGDAVFYFGPLRLRDLARIEAWVSGILGHPTDLLAEALAIGDPDLRRDAIREAYDRSETGPPTIGSPEASAVLDTPAGVVEVAYWSARRFNRPRVTREILRDAAASLTPPDWSRVAAIAWGTDPLDAAQMVVDAEVGFSVPSKPRYRPKGDDPWARNLWTVAGETGWTIDQILDLTLPQWAGVVACRGEPPVSEIVAPNRPRKWDDGRFKEEMDKRREFFKEGLRRGASGMGPNGAAGE